MAERQRRLSIRELVEQRRGAIDQAGLDAVAAAHAAGVSAWVGDGTGQLIELKPDGSMVRHPGQRSVAVREERSQN